MRILFIVIFLLINTGLQSQNDSLFITQTEKLNSTLKGICKEINEVSDSIALSEIKENQLKLNKILAKENSIKLNDTQYEGLLEINKSSEEKFNLSEFIGNLLVEMFAAFIGFGGALYLFYRESNRERKEEKRKKEQIESDKINYLKSLMHSAKSNITLQLDQLEINNKKILENPIYIYQPKLLPLEELERLQNFLNDSETYHAYINTYGTGIEHTEKYRISTSAIDYFKNQFKELRPIHYLESDYNRKINYKQLFDQLYDNVGKYGEAIQQTDTEFSLRILTIIKNYTDILNADPENFEIHQNNFVDPLKRLFIDEYFHKNEIKPLLVICRKATQLFNEIKQQNIWKTEKNEEMIKICKSTLDKLIENSNELELDIS